MKRTWRKGATGLKSRIPQLPPPNFVSESVQLSLNSLRHRVGVRSERVTGQKRLWRFVLQGNSGGLTTAVFHVNQSLPVQTRAFSRCREISGWEVLDVRVPLVKRHLLTAAGYHFKDPYLLLLGTTRWIQMVQQFSRIISDLIDPVFFFSFFTEKK